MELIQQHLVILHQVVVEAQIPTQVTVMLVDQVVAVVDPTQVLHLVVQEMLEPIHHLKEMQVVADRVQHQENLVELVVELEPLVVIQVELLQV
jgi:hypothetical protein